MKNPNQIIRLDGKNVFLEVLNNAFSISKVQINFVEYDTSSEIGKRQRQYIPIYIDLARFLVLCNDILTGRLSAIAQVEKDENAKSGFKYCKEIWLDQGGVPFEKLKSKGKARTDGMSLARMMKITPGEKLPWIFSAEQGPGEIDAKGLIVPKYGNKPEEVVRVALNDENLKKFALLTRIHTEAYISSQYVNVERRKFQDYRVV